MKIYIAEKPSLAKNIASALGNGKRIDGYIKGDEWIVTWCFGHLYEQFNPDDYNEKFKRWNLQDLPINPKESWKLKPKKDAKHQIKIIKELLKTASTVINAGDPDREGQLLVDELLEECKYNGETLRLWCNDLTISGLKKSIKEISDNKNYKGYYNSALTRSRADWLIGMNFTRALTIKAQSAGFDGVLSIGRVQTPTLNLVIERDNLIENFKPKTFYEIQAVFNHENGDYIAKFKYDENILNEDKKLLDKGVVQDINNKIENIENWTISNLKTKQIVKKPPLCFSLTDLQSEANKIYSMDVKKILDIAQSLYETKKIISYPRSECNYLTDNQYQEAQDIVNSLKKTECFNEIIENADLSKKPRVYNDKKAKSAAHTAIIPTNDASSIESLSDEERKIYDLIVKRFLVQFHKDNICEETSFNTISNEFEFNTKGIVTKQFGWLEYEKKIDTQKKKQALIKVNENDAVKLKESIIEEKNTTPPKYFTQGTLITAMNNIAKYINEIDAKKVLKDVEGIGTPATRGAIIETLQNRNFLENKGKNIISTKKAKQLIKYIPESLKSPIKTAEWEKKLSEVEKNNLSVDEFLNVQVEFIEDELEKLKTMEIEINKGAIKCPKCGNGVLRRMKGKFGFFWGCSDFKSGCKAIFKDVKNKPDLENKKPKNNETDCPVENCDGKAKQFTTKDKKRKFWICDTCEKNGRNKFLNDENGKPVPQKRK